MLIYSMEQQQWRIGRLQSKKTRVKTDMLGSNGKQSGESVESIRKTNQPSVFTATIIIIFTRRFTRDLISVPTPLNAHTLQRFNSALIMDSFCFSDEDRDL